MLAQTGTKPFNRKGFIYEPKLDGVRCVAYLDHSTRLIARSGHDITRKFPELAQLHKQVKKPCILDSEITGVCFNAIQHRIHQEKDFAIRIAQKLYPITFNAFDQMYQDTESIERLELLDRKEILIGNFVQSPVGLLVGWQDDYTIAENLYRHIEGMMAKAIHSTYQEGRRSDSWLKIKNFKEGDFYICGITEGENDRANTFGSLVLAQKVNGKLVYVGNVGSGFTHRQLDLMLKLAEIYRGECPFATRPDTDRPVKFWTRPLLKCEVRYLELSPNGLLRFPTFRKEVKDGSSI